MSGWEKKLEELQRAEWREAKRKSREARRAAGLPYTSEPEKAAHRRYTQKPSVRARLRARSRERRRLHPEKCQEWDRRCHAKNPERFRAKAAAYRARMSGKQDPRVRAFYVVCKWLRTLGDNVSVDHIIPLKRGGLHVFWNLRILDRAENCRKNARLPTDEEKEICRLWLETES